MKNKHLKALQEQCEADPIQRIQLITSNAFLKRKDSWSMIACVRRGSWIGSNCGEKKSVNWVAVIGDRNRRREGREIRIWYGESVVLCEFRGKKRT